MKPKAPLNKVELIERSLNCFAFGIAGALPLIGFPFAMVALSNYTQVKRRKSSAWNPARRHLVIGHWCAIAGMTLTLLITLWIVLTVVYPPETWRNISL
jgi:hypothetical protein